MRLSEFILCNMERILQGWEDFAREIQVPHRTMDVTELRDHAKDILEEIAAELACPDSARNFDPQGNTPGEVHADTRAESGFTVEQLLSEFRALRASVLLLWSQRDKTATWFEIEDMTRFNEAIDRALAESVARYSEKERQAQDIFLGILGHDLRTPLQAIRLSAKYLMRSESADSTLIQLGSRTYNSTVRMQKIIENLLDFIRSRTGGGLPIHPEETDLADICDQIAEECRASHPGKVIHTAITGDVRGKWDAVRIAQVYQNLIGNAIQYGSDTPITVLTYEDGVHAVLSVHNGGAPIPPGLKKNIFDPLRRNLSGAAHRGDRKNLGLGLYIVREIVAAHHGSIDVVSTEQDGTTFTVRLPRQANSPH